jgi:hypothetical protein
MSVERERTVAAEMLAVKLVMAHVLGRINQLDPVLAEAIQAEGKIRKTMAKSRQIKASKLSLSLRPFAQRRFAGRKTAAGHRSPTTIETGRESPWRIVVCASTAPRGRCEYCRDTIRQVDQWALLFSAGVCRFRDSRRRPTLLCPYLQMVRRNLTGDGIIFFAKQCPGDI